MKENGATTELCDDQVIKWACDKHSWVAGAWEFMALLTVAVFPFHAWVVHGNIEPFLRLYPVICLLIAAAGKPTVTRSNIILLERLVLYHEEHHDVLTHIAANAKTEDEEPIEKHNLMLRNHISDSKGNLTFADIQKASGLIAPLHGLREQLEGVFRPMKKHDKPEKVRLLEMSLAETQKETSSRVDDFIFHLCTRPFADPTVNAQWPRSEGVLSKGLLEMKKEIANTKEWIRKTESGINCETEDLVSDSLDDTASEDHPMLAWLLSQTHPFLKYECRLRQQRISGTKAELASRIIGHVEVHKNSAKYVIPERVQINELDTDQSRDRLVIPAGYSRSMRNS